MLVSTDQPLNGLRSRRRVLVTPVKPSRTPTVTVVIPCYNYARYLPSAVDSALRQQGVQVRVVVVDDRSADGSLRVARALADADDRVRVLANVHNSGPVATFNRGLEEVDSEFLVRLDADDLLTPGSLYRSTALAMAMPDVGLVYGRPVHFSGEVPKHHRGRVASWTVWAGTNWLRSRCLSSHNVLTSPEALMRTRVVRQVGGQQPLAHAHDMEMWLRMSAFSDVGHVNGPDQAWHREHPASLSSAIAEPSGLAILEERRRAFTILFSGMAGTLDEAGELLEVARMALCRDALSSACQHYDRGRAGLGYIEDLSRFARDTYDGYRTLPEWASLQRRLRLGTAASGRLPWHVGHAVLRRVKNERAYRHWLKWGVYSE